VSLSFLAKSFVSPSSLRFGIFYTTAAEDAPASDPITAWPAAGADPTLAFGVLLGSVSSATGGTWTTKLLEGVVVPVSALNVGVLIWADDDTLALGLAVGYFAKVKLEVSSERTTYLAEPYSELVARTDRFWAKTFKEDVTPADYAAEYDGALRCLTSDNRSADPDQGFVQWQFSTPMHKPPTIATFNPDTAAPAAGADFARVGTVSDVLAVADDISEERCVLSMNADASNRRAYRIHATANARFF